MKRIIGFGVTSGILLISQMGMAQRDPDAKKVLDAMSETYKTVHSFTADIIYSLVNVEDDINESFEGKIGVKQDKFRMVAEEQEIIISEGNVWTYLVEENEVNIDTYDPDESDISPSNIYTLYKKGYKYILFGQESIRGVSYNVVDLSPDDKDNEYFRIRLMINKSNNYLRMFTLYAKSGNRYIYEINNFNPNANLSDRYFVFDESSYKDVEVIDLRME